MDQQIKVHGRESAVATGFWAPASGKAKSLVVALASGALCLGLVVANAPAGKAAGDGPATITVQRSTSVNVSAIPAASEAGTLGPERALPKRKGGDPLRTDPANDAPRLPAGTGTPTTGGKKAKSNPALVWSAQGVNHRDTRLAYGGNQFSGEPPDQGLCVGNGMVLETVNSALRVYDATTGAARSEVLSLNEFYGFPPAINRSTGAFGPFTFDISCHFDPASNRWFHLAVDLEQDTITGDYTGRNYLDLAVSTSGDPTGTWNIYRIPGMNDGTEGTPDHDCPGGPCFADFPHIGVDANGVYITTNEFPLFADGFTGAQVYALSKSALVSGAATITATLFNTADDPVRPDEPGFTVWPALSAGKQFAAVGNGTQYFASSNAVFTNDGSSKELVVWALSNTASLNTASPAPVLRKTVIESQRYAVPPSSVQKAGTIPLGNLFYGATRPGPIDTSDSRVLDVRYANGKLWAVLGTAARVEGSATDRAGVAWYVLSPTVSGGAVSAKMFNQGILALADEALAYPTIGVTTAGRGVIGFTRVGENLFPSAGYASLDALAGAGPVSMAAAGNSPTDGFTEYGGRPRWGDYGAAAVSGSSVYLANEYIQQDPCTVQQFIASNYSCGGTRTQLANWSTRVSKLTP
jgi:hypothetical protein